MTKDEEKAETFNAFFTSVLSSKTNWSLCTSSLSGKTGKGCRMKTPYSKRKWLVSCYITSTHKSVELDGINPRVLTELAEQLTKQLSIIYQHLWQTKEAPVDWKFAKCNTHL